MKASIRTEAQRLGFADCGFTHTDLSAYEASYFNWLGQHFHGEMHYMVRHGLKRTRPNRLVPGTQTIISVRMNYYACDSENPLQQLQRGNHAYISRYALGRDYHKLIRNRLKKLVAFMEQATGPFNYRIFTDSAPVLERPIAREAGLGFIGKNSLVIHPRAGSWFFLGEIYTDLALPADAPYEQHGCGPCTACIDTCPTGAIVADGVVDARRCISYLTIEHPGSIPEPLRPLLDNRIYGCDDCQLVCPWNRFTEPTEEADFHPRHQLDRATLLDLWAWDEPTFLEHFAGSPIRRIGFERWQRNLAVALGNAPPSEAIIAALNASMADIDSEMVREHVRWALATQREKMARKKVGDPPLLAGRKAYLPKRCAEGDQKTEH